MSGEANGQFPICTYYVGAGPYARQLHRIEAVNPRQAALLLATGGVPLSSDTTIPWGLKQTFLVYELLDIESGELSEPHRYEVVVRVDSPTKEPIP